MEGLQIPTPHGVAVAQLFQDRSVAPLDQVQKTHDLLMQDAQRQELHLESQLLQAQRDLRIGSFHQSMNSHSFTTT
jgi:hypothetical protein